MNHLSLFSGIGGLDLAAEWAGFTTVAFVERDPYCQRVLAKRWPGVPIIDDVRLVPHAMLDRRDADHGREPIPDGNGDGAAHAAGRQELEPWAPGSIGLVSGGFPCQPHSVAGKRQASADDRDLWPEFARVIREIRPRWVVAENVPGLLHSESGRFFGSVLGDLADMGYSAGWGVWGAADVGALHRRERVFIVAHANGGRCEVERVAQHGRLEGSGHEQGESGQPRQPLSAAWGEPESRLGGMVDGLSPWLDEPPIPRVAAGVRERVSRLRALGNAVVPQQAYPLFRAIAEIERNVI